MGLKLEGVWLPIITPFKGDKVDLESYQRMIDYYADKGIAGLIPLGTTGESPAVADDEYEVIIDKTVEFVAGRLPILVGAGGNYTKKAVKQAKVVAKYEVQGILSVCPYYNRPDQTGIYEHFKEIAEATSLPVVIYNIPYRTGRNIENETLRKLAQLPNIAGLKDSCGDIKQSMELLLDPPAGFRILTGEDALFYLTLTLGGAGGILASSHLETESFVKIHQLVKSNDTLAALKIWRRLAGFIPLLFKEPNPAPIKYCLWRKRLIASLETRLPLTEISPELKRKLDQALGM